MLTIPEIQAQTRATLNDLVPWTVQEKMLLFKTVSSMANFLLLAHSDASDDQLVESANMLSEVGKLLEEHTVDVAQKIMAAVRGEKSADTPTDDTG